MPRARAELVCVSDTPFYHVISRCVRRTFLCGKDRATGRCYEHRRGWIEERIRLLARWCSLYKGPPLVQRYHRGDDLCPAELRRVDEYAESFRQRLGNLSWFMKCLNEPIARQANKEDDCTGHFYDGRPWPSPLRGQPSAVPI